MRLVEALVGERRRPSSGGAGILLSMRLEPGHRDGHPVVHLTHTTLFAEALCGEGAIDFLGTPDLAVLCEECDRIGREAGEDRVQWAYVARSLTLVETMQRDTDEAQAA